MSGIVFPTFLAGKMLTQRKTPTWNTKTQRALSGKESRISYRAYPLYEWELQYEFLNDNVSRVNYIPWSQDFTQWTPNSGGVGLPPVVVGAWVGSTAPDGTYTADRVILNQGAGTGGGTTYSQIAATLPLSIPSGTQLTYSVWMKTNDGTTASIALIYGPGGASTVVTVTPVWTRFQFTSVAPSGGVSVVYVSLNAGVSTATLYADLSCWGAQLELGPLATLYGSLVNPAIIQTFGAPVITSDLQTITGLINKMMGQYDTCLYQDPDFNSVSQQQFGTGDNSTTLFNLTATYMPGNGYGIPDGLAGQPEWVQNTLGAPVLFTNRYGAHEQLGSSTRKNIALQSNFAATWTATDGSITAAAATAPDGTTTAARFTDTPSNTGHYFVQAATITGGARYTFSVWLKHTNHQYVGLTFENGSSDYIGVIVDLTNNVLSNVFLAGTAYASNADLQLTVFPSGWVRVSLSGQLAAADTTIDMVIAFCNNATTAPWLQGYVGTGTDTFYGWGAQLEAGTQPTALIPTTTVAVTAPADYSLTTVDALWRRRDLPAG